ncbi:FadR/GntR family transcriptional regulator [Pasteurella testudinis]|uniref:FadR/GntR family transcriptional regulator n=1 Tax=Pasteurella testudinis TaxID=761 RepID=UPI004059775F
MSKANLIIQTLTQRILSDEYPIGSVLPGEIDLSQEFSVSRTSVRAALQTIANKGLISIIPKKRSVVNEVELWNWLDTDILNFFSKIQTNTLFVKNLLIARLTFEPSICAIAAINSNAKDLANIESGYNMMQEGAGKNDRELFLSGDTLFHHAIVKACKNPFLSSLEGMLSTAMLTSLNKTLEDHINNTLPALRSHEELLEAIRIRDSEKAKLISKKIILQAIRKTFDDNFDNAILEI